MFPKEAETYKIVVLVDNKLDKIIGAGALVVEKKFIRNAAVVSNIYFVRLRFLFRLDILKISWLCQHIEDKTLD